MYTLPLNEIISSTARKSSSSITSVNNHDEIFFFTGLDTGNVYTCTNVDQYTVRLLSFRTGIIKSICVTEMTLLLFSFRHRSLVTADTDLHGHTASGCLCRSRLCSGV